MEKGPTDALLIEETDEVQWESCTFTLCLGRVLTDSERSRFDEILTGWYERGLHTGSGPDEHGGGGFLHNMTDSTFTSGAYGSIIEWTVDLGSVNPHAYTVLVEAIQEFGREQAVPLVKLIVGYHDDFFC